MPEKINPSQYPSIVSMYKGGKNLTQIGEEYGVVRESIAKILRKLQIPIRNGNTRKAENGVNLKFFEEDTEGSAYFYGLLLSDGNISEKGKVSISLKATDSHILEDFRLAVGSNSNVTFHTRHDSTSSCSLVFTVKPIAESLNKLGMVPRKSLSEKAPSKFLLNKDFWRGMVDGDGCIQFPENKASPRMYLCGSEEVCNQFLTFCKTIREDITTDTVHMVGGLYRVTICASKAASVLQILYGDCNFSLKRKDVLAHKIIDRYSETLCQFK